MVKLSLNEYLSKYNLSLFSINGDGNCLYRCMSLHKFGEQESYRIVKENIAHYVQTNPINFNQYLEDDQTIGDLCTYILKEKSWGGEIDIYAACRIYNVKIVVLADRQIPLEYVPESVNAEELDIWYFVYINSCHYDCAFPNISVESNEPLIGFKGESVLSKTKCNDKTQNLTKNNSVISTANNDSSKSTTVGKGNESCELCGKSFKTVYTLKKHVENVHEKKHNVNVSTGTKINNEICDLCRKSFKTKKDLTKHLKNVHNNQQIFCQVCNNVYQSKYTLQSHMQKIHGETISCKVCGKSFKTVCVLKKHVENVHEKKHNVNVSLIDKSNNVICNFCSKLFKTKKYLTKHLKTVHNNQQIFCQVCNTGCHSKYTLQSHMQKIHGETISCEICGKSFKTVYTLKKHAENIHEKKLNVNVTTGKAIGIKSNNEICDLCGKSFKTKEYVTKHVKNVHNNQEIFCQVCNREYQSKYKLRNHMQKIHRNTISCEVCAKPFTTAVETRNHCREIHWRCTLCDKSFVEKNYLHDHITQVHFINDIMCIQEHVAEPIINNNKSKQTSIQANRLNSVKASLVKNFETDKNEGPTYICSCCGGLWFRRSIRKLDRTLLSQKSDKSFIDTVCKSSLHTDSIEWLCRTCYDYVSIGETPKLALVNGLEFPTIPLELEKLSFTEQRLVSARLPFMQIKTLGCDRQLGIKGNVVNVPIDICTTTSVLPRSLNESETVQLKLKRKLIYNRTYIYETIRPKVIYDAAKYLVKQPLYQQEGIVLSDSWLNSFDNQQLSDFDVTVYNSTKGNDDIMPSETETDISKDNWDETVNDLPSNVGNMDTLLLDRDGLDSNAVIEMAPGENKIPLSLIRDEFCEELAYPKIYCGSARQVNKSLKIPYSDIAKAELRNYDRRCAQDISNIFFKHRKIQMQRFVSSISIALRKTKGDPKTFSASSLLDSSNVSEIIKQNKAFRILKQIRGSPAYWESIKKDLLATIRQIGTPHIFFTFSCAESKWRELHKILYKTVKRIELADDKKLSFNDIADLVRADPVTVARYFEMRFSSFFKNIIEQGELFGVVKDWYQRIEIQGRGSCHVHGFLFLELDLKYDENDKDSISKCEEYIDQHFTCHKPDGSNPSLQELVKLQYHKHSRSCKKNVDGKNRCRFGIPYFPMPKTCILEPLKLEMNDNGNIDDDKLNNTSQTVDIDIVKVKETVNLITESINDIDTESDDRDFYQFLSSLGISEELYMLAVRTTIKRSTVFLKRRPCEVRINSYNTTLLQLWQANIDVQFILNPYSCIQYIVDYIDKAERGMSNALYEACEEARLGNLSIEQTLKHVCNKFINSSEISAQECIFHVLQMPLSKNSRDIVYINTNPPHERVYMKKSKSELELLDPDCTDVVVKGMLDHYLNRPNELEDICLADFAANYTFHTKLNKKRKFDEIDNEVTSNFWKLKDNSGYIIKRTKSRIIRYRRYDVTQNKEDFYREQLMLYLPYRNEDTEIVNVDHELLYLNHDEQISENRKKFICNVSDDEIDLALSEIEKNKIIHANGTENEENSDDNNMEYVAIQADTSDHVDPDLNSTDNNNSNSDGCLSSCNLASTMISKEERLELTKSLNTIQKMIFLDILYKIRNGITFTIYLAGSAGVGKSRVISAIYQNITTNLNSIPGANPDLPKVLICAPTGKAAYILKGGRTIHNTFALPVSQYSGAMVALSPDLLNTYSCNFNAVKLLIIDEISMCGNRIFYQIDKRLKQIMHSDQPFGGISVLVVGDFYQLPPVGDKFVFDVNKNKGGNIYADLIGPVLWRSFSFIELTEIMRQKDDKAFAEALYRLGRNCMNENDIILFKSREFMENDNTIPKEAIHLFYSNSDVDRYNDIFLNKLDTEGIESESQDICIGEVPQKTKQYVLNYIKGQSAQQTAGLKSMLLLKKDALYMIVCNIDVSDGLFNGAIGRLKYIEYGKLQNGKTVAVRLWLQFNDTDIGSNIRSKNKKVAQNLKLLDNLTPIVPVTRKLIRRASSSNITVNRRQFPLVPCQAMTIHKSQGGTYTHVVIHLKKGITRSALYVACSRAKTSDGLFLIGEFIAKNIPPENERVTKEITRLQNDSSLKFSLQFIHTTKDGIKMIFHNSRSLAAHYDHVINDRSFMCCDVLMFCETNFKFKNEITLPGFQIVANVIHNGKKACGGSAVYMKNDLLQHCDVIESTDTVISEKSHIEICIFSIHTNIFITIYKSPNVGFHKFVEIMTSVLEKLISWPSTETITCIGDFNVSPEEIILLNQFFNNYAMYLKSPSEPSTNYGSQLDFVYSSNRNITSGYYVSYYSDHSPIWIVMS
jgi:hypothetical protein